MTVPKLINNSPRAITIVDTLLSPGQPKDVTEEVYNNPAVQNMLKERVAGSDKFVLAVADDEGGEEEESDEGEEDVDEEETEVEGEVKSAPPASTVTPTPPQSTPAPMPVTTPPVKK